jgi:hypothetical protein
LLFFFGSPRKIFPSASVNFGDAWSGMIFGGVATGFFDFDMISMVKSRRDDTLIGGEVPSLRDLGKF